MARRRRPEIRPEAVRELLNQHIGEAVDVQYKRRRRKREMTGTIVDVCPSFVVIDDERGINTTFSYANIVCGQVHIFIDGEDLVELIGEPKAS